MNLNGQSSKNRKTILNGKPLYDYDQTKKRNYFQHVKIHNKLTKQWRNVQGAEIDKKLIEIIIRVIIALCIIVFIISFL